MEDFLPEFYSCSRGIEEEIDPLSATQRNSNEKNETFVPAILLPRPVQAELTHI